MKFEFKLNETQHLLLFLFAKFATSITRNMPNHNSVGENDMF